MLSAKEYFFEESTAYHQRQNERMSLHSQVSVFIDVVSIQRKENLVIGGRVSEMVVFQRTQILLFVSFLQH